MYNVKMIHKCTIKCTLFIVFRFQFTIGRLPFEGENIYKLFGAISTGKFTIPTDVPYALQDLLKGNTQLEIVKATGVDLSYVSFHEYVTGDILCTILFCVK